MKVVFASAGLLLLFASQALADNCLQAANEIRGIADPLCSLYLEQTHTVIPALPVNLPSCLGSPSKVSSLCSTLLGRTASCCTPTTLSTSGTCKASTTTVTISAEKPDKVTKTRTDTITDTITRTTTATVTRTATDTKVSTAPGRTSDFTETSVVTSVVVSTSISTSVAVSTITLVSTATTTVDFTSTVTSDITLTLTSDSTVTSESTLTSDITITSDITVTSDISITSLVTSTVTSVSIVTTTATVGAQPGAVDQSGCPGVNGGSIFKYTIYCGQNAGPGSYAYASNLGYNFEDCASQCFEDPDNGDCLGVTYTPPAGGAFNVNDGHLQPGTCTFFQFISSAIPGTSSSQVVGVFENTFFNR